MNEAQAWKYRYQDCVESHNKLAEEKNVLAQAYRDVSSLYIKDAEIIDAAQALITRQDFWDQCKHRGVAIPGEYDTLVDLLKDKS